MTDRLVAIGRRLEELPPSKAPLVIGLGVVLVMVGVALKGFALPGGGVVNVLALVVFLAGVVMAWWRLSIPGRVLLAAPQVLWVLALAVHAAGDAATAQVLMLIGLAIFVVAFLLIVEPVGAWSAGLHLQRGRVNRRFLRSHRLEGPVECRVEPDGVRIVAAQAEPQSLPTGELGPARLEVQPTHTDLSIFDCYGDVVVRIRGTTEEEKRGLASVAEELKARATR